MISKLKIFLFSAIIIAALSCGSDDTSEEPASIGKNSNVAQV